MRSGLPGVAQAVKGALAWDPRGIVEDQEMLVDERMK